MKKAGLFFCLIMSIVQITTAQDVRFSQYYAAPLYLNPALSGSYNGMYKLTAIYRDQWRGALNQALYTAGFSADGRFQIGERQNTDAASGGIMFLTDRTGLYDFNTTFIGLTCAYHKIIDAKSRTYLSGGFRFAMINKSVNYENLTFQDMFNGVDQYSFATSENLPVNTLTFADMAIGLNFSTQPREGALFSIGASVSHILNNNISFYRDEVINAGEKKFIKEARINKLYHVDVQYTFPLSRYFSLGPRTAWRLQGSFMEFTAGSAARLRFRRNARFAMHFGLWGRVNNFLDSYSFTSVVSMVGFEVNGVIFGFSYDANIPDYINYSFGIPRNTFELSISYVGNYTNNTIKCPTL